ncbi:GGDEF domain-containing protein [Sphingobium sp. OAS761]|uniref:GGDEF domain-containing protein n=1 Tax=Sphingobium sp. OAS761 TaxID=2817901 RepID=UPI0020A14A48|nr:sensor domain-containing diguanylate cyclase [Sphingobium sp. OAS761]
MPDPEMAADLARLQRRFAATFDHAPVGIAHVGLNGEFLLVNPRFCEISGHDADTLIRTGFQQITHPDDLTADEALLVRLNAGEIARYSMEKRYIRADGTMIWINLTVAMVRDEDGAPDFYLAVIEDLSELRQASFEAIHDPLTGLLNRRGFAARAKDMLTAATRAGRSASLLFLDLDGFKVLNDTLGHAAGDMCLIDVARLLEAEVHAGDIAARIGGDEFLLLLAERAEQDAQIIGERVCETLAAYGMGVSGSFGLVSMEAPDPADLDRLIACADDAMRAAKRAGKNQLWVAAFI